MRLLITVLLAFSQASFAQEATSTSSDFPDLNQRIEINGVGVLLKGGGLGYEYLTSPHIGLGIVVDTFEITKDSDDDNLFADFSYKNRAIRGGVRARFYQKDPLKESTLYGTIGAMYAQAEGEVTPDEWTGAPSVKRRDSMFGGILGAGYHVNFQANPSSIVVVAFGASIEPGTRFEWNAEVVSGQTQADFEIGYGLGLEASLGIMF